MSDQSVGLLTQLKGERRAPPAEIVHSGPTSVSDCVHAGEASEPSILHLMLQSSPLISIQLDRAVMSHWSKRMALSAQTIPTSTQTIRMCVV